MKRIQWAFCLVLSMLLQCAWCVEPETLDLGNNVKLEVIAVPAGTFKMGSPAAEAGRNVDEDQKEVTIAEPFLIGKFPVTRGQYARFIQESGYKTEAEVGSSGGFGFDGKALVQRKDFTWRNPGFPQTDDHPVVMVTIKDAEAFNKWLARKTGKKVSLPSEEQWEYACRAGTITRFYSGDTDESADAIAWFKDNSGDGTRPVGGKQVNAFGLFDMSGNVYEWCRDLYGPYKPGGPVKGDMDKPRNVLRGGSWFKGRSDVRSAARYRNTPGSRNADNGFRVVIAAAPPVQVEAPIAQATATQPDATPPTPVQPDEGNIANSAVNQTPIPHSPVPLKTFHYSGQSNVRFSLSVLVPLLMFAAVAFVFLLIVRKATRGSSLPGAQLGRTGVPPPLGAQGGVPAGVRLAQDGIWLSSSHFFPGDTVRVTCNGAQGPMNLDIAIEPGPEGQFIYTGAYPTNVHVEVLSRGGSVQQQPDVWSMREPNDSFQSRSHEQDRDVHRGFPSAY